MRKIHRKKGTRFGRLIILHQTEAGKHPTWMCRCDCGTEKEILFESMQSGKTQSCGCLNIEKIKERMTKHGENRVGQRTPEYDAWAHIKTRTTNKNYREFHLYGGRGITMAKRWLNCFENFLEDMGRRPSKDHSIDRIDNNKGYTPKNCRWATEVEQQNNRRDNVLMTFKGETMSVSAWGRKLGIIPSVLFARIKRWGKIDRVLTQPKRVSVNGKYR